MVGRVGLTDKAGSASGRYRVASAGVDVALGIIGQPELVFLDEPTTGFDPEARRQFWDVVRDLAKVGTSVLLTTHYLEEAEALADRVAVINRGRVSGQRASGRARGEELGIATVSWWGERRLAPQRHQRAHGVGRPAGGPLRRRSAPAHCAPATLEDTYMRLIGAKPATDYEKGPLDRGKGA